MDKSLSSPDHVIRSARTCIGRERAEVVAKTEVVARREVAARIEVAALPR